MSLKKVLLVPVLVILTFWPCLSITYPAAADSAEIPIRVAVMTDSSYNVSSTGSDLFRSIKQVLDRNRIPVIAVDAAQFNAETLMNKGALRYSVLVLMNPGFKFDPDKTRLVADAVRAGMGIVALLPDTINDDYQAVFGVRERGQDWLKADAIRFEKDTFTLSYGGQVLPGDFLYLAHILAPGAEIVARINGKSQPAIWTYRYGSGKAVFQDYIGTGFTMYQGILLQSVLYAMPVGVSLPVAAGSIQVDDYPRVMNAVEDANDWGQAFGGNFNRLLKDYNFQGTFFITFSYSGNIDDFWASPGTIQACREEVEWGYELGLHAGSKHVPLDEQAWGGTAAVDAEVQSMMAMVRRLQAYLAKEYSLKMDDIVSYAAPVNRLSEYGYQSLNSLSTVKFIGVASNRTDAAYEGSDRLTFATYPITSRDLGPEPGTRLFNLPRMQGGFFKFNQPQDKDYAATWNAMRAAIESGDAYLIYTHPDEREIVGQTNGPTDPQEVFQAYLVWADYVIEQYPYYRWVTAKQLGQYLEKRGGAVDASWFPAEKIIRLRGPALDDVIDIKTDYFVRSVNLAGDILEVKLSDTPVKNIEGSFDVFQVGHDFFIASKQSTMPRANPPQTPFIFKETPPGLAPTPAAVEPTPALPAASEPISQPSEGPRWRVVVTFAGAAILVIVGAVTVHFAGRAGPEGKK